MLLKDTFQNWFFKNSSNALKIRIFDLYMKIISLILYFVQTYQNDYKNSKAIQFEISIHDSNISEINNAFESNFSGIEWSNIFYCDRSSYIRYSQLGLACHGIFDIIIFVLFHNGDILYKIEKSHFIIGLITTIPWFLEISISQLKNILVPMFLIIWLIKRDLVLIFHNYNLKNSKIITNHRNHKSIITQELILLASSLVCLITTSTCGLYHLQQGSREKRISLFDSFYFIIITFSTVGYGDISPDIWISKLYMSIMIIVAFMLVPKQIEQLVMLIREKRNLGDAYNENVISDKHIVVCSSVLQQNSIFHFLSEFYKYKTNQQIKTVLMSASKMDHHLSSLLHTPLWKQRVFYMYGSALRVEDLERAKVKTAKAVFLLASRDAIEKELADQQTVFRAWSIRDYAPHVPQFIQIFRIENKIHVEFADHVICDDDIKYKILANNALFPGISSFITLLINKIDNKARNLDDWQKQYYSLARNEINSVLVYRSNYFKKFVGQSFHYACLWSHKLYNVCLLGISAKKNSMTSKEFIILNPGADYRLKAYDLCFYISIKKDKYYSSNALANPAFEIKTSISPILNLYQPMLYNTIENEVNKQIKARNYDVTVVTPTSMSSAHPVKSACIVLKHKQEVCCLELNGDCEHKKNKHASDYKWKNKSIIVAAHNARLGLYNFIRILRTYDNHSDFNIKPIVLLLENSPSIEFLETISIFPCVYWIKGSISSMNALRKAGIEIAELLVAISIDKQHKPIDDGFMFDSTNILSAQNIRRFFPNVKVISELINPFFARYYDSGLNKLPNNEEDIINYNYSDSVSFSAGDIFFASLIDTLLYQAFYKPYIIDFVSMLIGDEHTCGCLKKTEITKDNVNIGTYGSFYELTLTTSGDIPIAIYRKEKLKKKVKQQAKSDNYDECVSHILINPYKYLILQIGDLVYSIRQSNDKSQMEEF